MLQLQHAQLHMHLSDGLDCGPVELCALFLRGEVELKLNGLQWERRVGRKSNMICHTLAYGIKRARLIHMLISASKIDK